MSSPNGVTCAAGNHPSYQRAFLLDRDGVINYERSDYVKSWAEFAFLPGVLSALQQLATVGAPILIISNQSAIGRGLVSQAAVDALHHQMRQMVIAAGGRIDGFFLCPHHPEANCDCRKPKPGLLLQAATAFGLALPECTFIGDAVTDWQAAQAADCQSILVESGRQGPHLRTLFAGQRMPPIVPNLADAVTRLLSVRQETYV